ncbi:MAG: sodium:proton antiporter [Asticcacaulis sp.]
MPYAALSPFDAASVLIVLAAVLGYINHISLKLPASVGMTFMGALASLAVLGIDKLLPESHLTPLVLGFLDDIDFHQTLMNGMISFLLFAGALHVNWTYIKAGFLPILLLSTIGVILSTAIVGGGFYILTQIIGLPVPLMWCLVFGALISPTDPVAVMAVMKHACVPPTLQATVAGESLFNDGVGVVVFGILLGAAMGGGEFSLSHAGMEFLKETGGGVVLGLLTGAIAYYAMRSIDDYNVEVIISLAVVMGGYTLANIFGVSGPVAMAIAGLIIGNAAVAHAMSDTTRDYVLKFWSLIDEILNAVLFLLIGLEVIAVSRDWRLVVIGLASIPLVLAARTISVTIPLTVLRPFQFLGKMAMPTLVWGGLRGGISVALALSLPGHRTVILAATYIVVLFAVIFQGGTIGKLILKWTKKEEPPNIMTLH